MLFDPRREKYPVLYRFIAWLREKPAAENYNWFSPDRCACAQFFGTGFDWYIAMSEARRNEGVDLNDLAYAELNWTFGALLKRAERKLDELTGAVDPCGCQ